MRRRFANKMVGDYRQKRVDNDSLKGYASFIKIKGLKKPLVVLNGDNSYCIADENYEWIEVYEDGENYALTIMYDAEGRLIEWYFDIAREVGIEDGIPYEDDLYIDYVIEADGKESVLDEDELLAALNNNTITKEEFDLAYVTLEKLKSLYSGKKEKLLELSDRLKKEFERDSNYDRSER